MPPPSLLAAPAAPAAPTALAAAALTLTAPAFAAAAPRVLDRALHRALVHLAHDLFILQQVEVLTRPDRRRVLPRAAAARRRLQPARS